MIISNYQIFFGGLKIRKNGGSMKDNVQDYLSHKKSKNFNELLFSYIDEKGYKDSEIYKKGNIDRKLFSKIRCSTTYIPRKNVIIKLCFALGLEEGDFHQLLNSAGYSLSNNTNFDLIISYCLENHIYDLNRINDYLFIYANAVL